MNFEETQRMLSGQKIKPRDLISIESVNGESVDGRIIPKDKVDTNTLETYDFLIHSRDDVFFLSLKTDFRSLVDVGDKNIPIEEIISITKS